MAEKTFAQLTALDQADVEQDDYLPILDVHDLTQSAAGSTKKVALSSLFEDTPLVTPTLTDPTLAGTVTVNNPLTAVLVPKTATGATGQIYKTATTGMTFRSPGGTNLSYSFQDATGLSLFGVLSSDDFFAEHAVIAQSFKGGNATPSVTTSGTATITSAAIPSPSNNAAGEVTWTVTVTGSWVVRVTYGGSGYALAPFPVIFPTTDNVAALNPYISARTNSYFEVTGNNFSTTGGYGFTYNVIG